MWPFKAKCSHEFISGQGITLTGIKYPDEPHSIHDYFEWVEWYKHVYTCDAHVNRVYGECHKCGKGFYAHCGIELQKYGKLV